MRVAALAAAAVVVAAVGGRAVLRGPPELREVSTAAAHRAVVRLRDGTQVTLAPKSRLRYTADYGSAHRDVYLEGEAYFQVTNDTRRPFRVHTTGSVTEDLGTAFMVRAYADQRATEVVVAEGRVALWRPDSGLAAPAAGPQPDARPGLVLEARDLGRLDPNGVTTFRRGVDVGRHLAWTRGVLVFDGTPLRDVVLTLGRWYDVEIHVEPSDSALAARRVTATFDNESLDLVLKRIALTLGVRVERAGGSVLLLRNGR
jgi:ferric-dicitrate binding protein FerR (iron transport regulator)